MAEDNLRPATTAEIAESIAFALRYDGRKRVHHADEMMARITAERLVQHLRDAGFVVMRQPSRQVHSDRGHRHGDTASRSSPE